MFLCLVLLDTRAAGALPELSSLAWRAEVGGGSCGGTWCHVPSIILLLTTLLKTLGELGLQQHTTHCLPFLLQLTRPGSHIFSAPAKPLPLDGTHLLFPWLQTQRRGQQKVTGWLTPALSSSHTSQLHTWSFYPRASRCPLAGVWPSAWTVMWNKMRTPRTAEPPSSVAVPWEEL